MLLLLCVLRVACLKLVNSGSWVAPAYFWNLGMKKVDYTLYVYRRYTLNTLAQDRDRKKKVFDRICEPFKEPRNRFPAWQNRFLVSINGLQMRALAFSRSNNFINLAPSPPGPSPLVSSTGDTQEDWKRETTCSRERGEGGGRGAESYDRKKAWSSINHSMLSGYSHETVSS